MMSGTASIGWSWWFGLLVIAGIVLIIFVIVRMLSNRSDSASASVSAKPISPEPSAARLILDERFARGDLTAEQYRDQVRILGESR